MRTITVKGIGRVTAKPDYVVLSMGLDSEDVSYEKAMDLASRHLEQLREAVEAVGFEKDSLKTTNFNVRAVYNQEQDEKGMWQQVFKGYNVSHSVKLEFDFTMEKLSEALAALAGCVACPNLNIQFTVKDPTAVKDELLRSAAVNARKKAEILCEASGVKLGQLVTIDYNWGEISVNSPTRYMAGADRVAAPMVTKAIEIAPDVINTKDTATFVWEIE